MAFKSEAQKRHLQERLKSGAITQAQYNEYAKGTPKGKLPERLTPARVRSTDDLRKLAKEKK